MKTATILQFPLEKALKGRYSENDHLAECDGLSNFVEPAVIDSHYKKEGFKYQQTKDLDFKDVVKLIRQDIKKAYPAKEGWKFSIRSESGRCCSIDVRILKSPFSAETEDFKEWSNLNVGASMLSAPARYTPAFQAAYDQIKLLVDTYNFDDSDSMTDYFHNRFYSHIYVDVD